MRIRFLAILGLGAIFLWMSVGAPLPQQSITPTKLDTRIPTFERSQADRVELKKAVWEGRLVESSRQHALRVAVLQAGDRLEASPCDRSAREALRVAATEFLAYQREMRDKPPMETLVVDGRTIDAVGFLDADASTIVSAAIAAGIVPTSATGSGWVFQQAFAGERFACGGAS